LTTPTGRAYVERGKAGTGLLEKIELFIPGFRGYKEKEIRRESDRLIRNQVYQKLSEATAKAKDVYRSLVNQGVSEAWDDTDHMMAKLDRITERINHSEYGYAGFFDIAKVKEPELDRMIDYDLQMLQMAEAVGQAVNTLKESVDGERPAEARGKVKEALKTVDALEAAYNNRKQVILGVQ